LDLYPGKFRAGLSQLRFTQPAGNDVIAYISLDPGDEFAMRLNIDPDTVPGNTIIAGRGTVDAVINPETFNPIGIAASGTRYLILEDINITDRFSELNFSRYSVLLIKLCRILSNSSLIVFVLGVSFNLLSFKINLRLIHITNRFIFKID
jgi:hypothetical protein